MPQQTIEQVEEKYFKKYPETRVTFIDQLNNKSWTAWKKYNECTQKEKETANLREIFPNEIVFDIENKDVENIKKRLSAWKFNYILFDSGSRGLHSHIFFYNLEEYIKDTRTSIRKILIKDFNADLSKASESTLIAMFSRPHFKTMKPKTLIESTYKDELQSLPQEAVLRLREEKFSLEEVPSLIPVIDENFKDYHLKDSFFQLINKNIIPDNTFRDTIIFPNIAIALVKEGLSELQIRELMEPIIKNNFPGKNYNEFQGWVKKALNGKIDTYNTIQLNQWIQKYFQLPPIYETKSIPIMNLFNIGLLNTNKRIYSYLEFKNLECPDTEWLVNEWLPVGDICFIVGKSNSYKSTFCMHLGFAIIFNKLVFNKYNTTKGNVLYTNEENNMRIIKDMAERIKKGLDISEDPANFFISNNENFSLDNIKDIEEIIKFINENKITFWIIDSFRRLFSGKENDATDMAIIFNKLKYIRSKCNNLTIGIIHHMKKNNEKGNGDIRDMLRGSSDIANFADSIIAIERKTGKELFTIEHIKLRASIEKEKVGIKIDCGEKKDKAYFYEIADLNEETRVKSEPEVCAEKIVQIIENNNLRIFSRNEIIGYTEISEFNEKAVIRALQILVGEGTLTKVEGNNKKQTKYQYTGSIQDTLT